MIEAGLPNSLTKPMNNLQKTKLEIMEKARTEKMYQYLQVAGFTKEFQDYLESSLNRIIQSIKESMPEPSSGEPLQMPCPDGQIGCLVSHYSSENYIQDYDKGYNQYRQEVLDLLEKGKE